MHRAVPGVATLLVALCMAGCSAATPAASPGRAAASVSSAQRSVESSLQAQAFSLGRLLDQAPVDASPEPKHAVSQGTLEAIVENVSASGASPGATFDFVSPRPAPGTDSQYWNRFKVAQRLPFASEASDDSSVTIAVRDGSGNLHVLSAEEFSARVNSDPDRSDHAYWVNVDGGRVYEIWEAWAP